MMKDSRIPAYMKRLPSYLTYLKQLAKDGVLNVSATSIAAALGLGDVLVRKDLASVSGEGKPRVGYETYGLITAIEKYLGYDNLSEAVIVGAGSLGRAILGYGGFDAYGLRVSAGFDISAEKEGTVNGKSVYNASMLESYCKEHGIRLAILTVPAENAQSVCDSTVKCGIRGILNFAPVHLKVPSSVTVQNENIAAALAVLANKLTEQKE